MLLVVNRLVVFVLFCCLVLPTLLPTRSLAQDNAVDNNTPVELAIPDDVKIPDDEKPFWESAQKFLDAYALKDAKLIGDLFAEDAEFLDELGVRSEGREAIVNRFSEAFADSPDALIESISIDKIKQLGNDVALEEGTVVSSVSPQAPRSITRYAAIHRKNTEGVWLIAVLKDFPREDLGRQEQLDQLSWLIGEWINEESDAQVYTACRWSDDGNYLLREFKVRTSDDRELSGVQRIGWDPINKKLRSWTFDSAGGFFNGFWTKTDSGWLLTSDGVSAEGESVTSTSVYKIVDAEMITWQYQNLILGDVVQGEVAPITMVRKPPEPQIQTSQNQ